MATVEDLEKRLSKLEKDSPVRFFVQYLLSPLLIVAFGTFMNWQIERLRSDVSRLDVAQKMVANLLAPAGSLAQEGLQVQHHPAGKLSGEARETQALIESRRGLVDGVRDEKAKRDRAAASELKDQPQGLLEEVPAKTLALHALVDGKTREQHCRDRKARQPIEGFDRLHRSPLHAGGGQGEVSGEAYPAGCLLDGKIGTPEEILLRMPQGEAAKIVDERLVLVPEVLEQRAMVPPEHFDTEGHGSGRVVLPVELWWPSLWIGETRERPAQSRGRRKAAVQNLGEPLDLGICELDTGHDTVVVLPADPLDGGTAQRLYILTAPRLDPPTGFGLADHPRCKGGELAQQVSLLVLAQAEPLAQVIELVIQKGVGLGLETRHLSFPPPE